jgi:hypothetical protein
VPAPKQPPPGHPQRLATLDPARDASVLARAPTPAPSLGGTCTPRAPAGSRADLKTQVHASTGAAIDEPVTCAREPGAFIRVHGRGRRPIGFANAACKAAGCITIEEIGRAVGAHMHARGITAGGIGEGVCGDTRGDYDAWNISIAVNDWKDADVAIEVIDEELRAHDAGPYFGVSVRAEVCSVDE